MEAQKKGKVPQGFFEINDNFFSNWSPEMAYVLGLIATDGCVSKSGTVSLCINDKDLLEKVRLVMDSEHKICRSKYQEGLYSFHFARPRLVKDLAALGILPRKSLNIKFPAVPDAFLIDFVRGVFDGDGSVYFEKRSERYPLRTTFVSSSQEFIEKLEIVLRQMGLPERVIHRQTTKNGLHFKIRYSHKDSAKLFHLMYNDTANSLFLGRKYNKFLDGFQKENSGAEYNGK
ncbi:MAG: LAGLIDADG family homing endonuclease [Candidatus Omnitrophica bacterium]|nr:LAGLIDADG family homing endonuclease [Candidatus Omnitrophota bacterium]